MNPEISIQFTRFSAFYSPLIATMAGGFLEQEGLRSVIVDTSEFEKSGGSVFCMKAVLE